VEKPLSREERIANHRKRVSETKEMAEAVEMSEMMETSKANALEETILSHEHDRAGQSIHRMMAINS
jgi:hypothetical protein